MSTIYDINLTEKKIYSTCNKNVLANSLTKLSQEKIIQILKDKLYGGGGGGDRVIILTSYKLYSINLYFPIYLIVIIN